MNDFVFVYKCIHSRFLMLDNRNKFIIKRTPPFALISYASRLLFIQWNNFLYFLFIFFFYFLRFSSLLCVINASSFRMKFLYLLRFLYNWCLWQTNCACVCVQYIYLFSFTFTHCSFSFLFHLIRNKLNDWIQWMK